MVGGAVARVKHQVGRRFGQVGAVICVWDPGTVAGAGLAADRAALQYTHVVHMISKNIRYRTMRPQ